jgi:murein L,D-transpeptidase YafK
VRILIHSGSIRGVLPRALVVAAFVFCGAFAGKGQTGQKLTADRIVVEKSAHTMTLLRQGKVLKTYTVALSTVPVGAKEHTGDHKVPEGLYTIDRKNPHSQFHLALHISYPNAADSERARKLGLAPGGDIEIHGLSEAYSWIGGVHRAVDWTDGCVAVTNAEIEEIYPLVPVGTPLEIRP